MMVALWQFDKEDLLAGLLLFRLLYYVTPFTLALIVLGIRELVPKFHALHAPPPSAARSPAADAQQPAAGGKYDAA